MIPSAAAFNSTVRSMGIGDGHKIVVYDGIGMRSAPRVWWMFRMFEEGCSCFRWRFTQVGK